VRSRASRLGSVGDPAMSDLEFRRALSPDQMREALSLLDGAARAKRPNEQVGDSNSVADVGSGVDQGGTTIASPNRLPAAEDARQRNKQLSPVLAFYGLGFAAAAALMVLSWSESALKPPGLPGIAGEQHPNPQPAQLVKSAPPELLVVDPTSDRSSLGSERRHSKPGVANAPLVDQANDGDDQAAARGPSNRASATPHPAHAATVGAIATNQAWWDERASRKPKEVWWRTSAVRVAAAKKRFWRRHWQPLTEINGGECFHPTCAIRYRQRVFYEPPRYVTQ
jgi:hypothetical protein